MAEEKQAEKKADKGSKHNDDKKEEVKKNPRKEENQEMLIRILGFDIPASKNVMTGLTRIKGISWSISNAICRKLGIPRTKRISEFTKPEIQKLEEFLKSLNIYDYLKNRRSDPETGKVAHIYGTDLDMARAFDIKRMKTMKSYVGIRHTFGLPVRGQKTRSHFRTKGRKVVAFMKGAAKPAPKPAAAAPAKGGKK